MVAEIKLCTHCEVRKVPQGDGSAARTCRRLGLCNTCYKSPKARAERQQILHIKPGTGHQKGRKASLFQKLDVAFNETIKISEKIESELQSLVKVTDELTLRGQQYVFQLRERIERGRSALTKSVASLTTANASVRRELKRVIDMRTGVDELLKEVEKDES